MRQMFSKKQIEEMIKEGQKNPKFEIYEQINITPEEETEEIELSKSYDSLNLFNVAVLNDDASEYSAYGLFVGGPSYISFPTANETAGEIELSYIYEDGEGNYFLHPSSPLATNTNYEITILILK